MERKHERFLWNSFTGKEVLYYRRTGGYACKKFLWERLQTLIKYI